MHGNHSNQLIYDHQHLDVGHGHLISIEQSGNPNGIPVLYLHGGPGAGLGKHYQWPFDLKRYRVIGFDQRGCGRSTPTGNIAHNNTDYLLQDIEQLREYLQIDSWIVFGGSWGSTLALLYAIKYTQRVNALVLRGIFLARKEDFEWFLMPNGGAAQVFPDIYQNFRRNFKSSDSFLDVCEQYIRLFQDEHKHKSALQDWYNWEGHISRLQSSAIDASDLSSENQVRNLALLECHYLLNHCFVEENFIIDNIQAIRHIPCHIVHGRYDMVCKVESALTLHHHLPQSTLDIIDNAGHSMSENGIAKRLVEIMCNEF
ncbi:proline iminopeptidase [Glaciecola sp. KUL10]|nr:proline iminopeptidase [Glaciecola sp. KUL10]